MCAYVCVCSILRITHRFVGSGSQCAVTTSTTWNMLALSQTLHESIRNHYSRCCCRQRLTTRLTSRSSHCLPLVIVSRYLSGRKMHTWRAHKHETDTLILGTPPPNRYRFDEFSMSSTAHKICMTEGHRPRLSRKSHACATYPISVSVTSSIVIENGSKIDLLFAPFACASVVSIPCRKTGVTANPEKERTSERAKERKEKKTYGRRYKSLSPASVASCALPFCTFFFFLFPNRSLRARARLPPSKHFSNSVSAFSLLFIVR